MAKTVLIVDDVAFVRKTLKDIFTAAHFHVVGEAATGEEAIAQFQKLNPDIVTMDVVMPVMSGIDAIRKILKISKMAKIIVVSAMTQEQIVMEAVHVGAVDFVIKPFEAKDILRAAEKIVQSQSGES